MRRILQLPSKPSSPAAREMEAAINNYMRRAAEAFDLNKNTEVGLQRGLLNMEKLTYFLYCTVHVPTKRTNRAFLLPAQIDFRPSVCCPPRRRSPFFSALKFRFCFPFFLGSHHPALGHPIRLPLSQVQPWTDQLHRGVREDFLGSGQPGEEKEREEKSGRKERGGKKAPPPIFRVTLTCESS